MNRSALQAADLVLPRGQLEVVLDGRYAPYMWQHFRDSKRATVEAKLPELFAGLD